MSYENMFGLDDLEIEKMRLVGLLEREGMTDATQGFIMKWTKDMEIKTTISSKEMIRFNVDRVTPHTPVDSSLIELPTVMI